MRQGTYSEYAFVAGEDRKGERLDVFLSREIPDLSRSHFKRLILDGLVLVNGLAAKPSYETRAGDRIGVRIPWPAPGDVLRPEPMPLEILFEDEDVLVVNKGPGVVVHPGAGHAEGTLVHGLLAHSPKLALQGSPLRPGIVHRLDKDTSGALAIAKSERAYLDLVRQFKRHEVKKEYLALVYGAPSRKSGEIRTRLDRHPADRKRMAVSQGRGREAVSLWRIEKTWEEVSLLDVEIQTGRTHQIRVHMSHLHHPIIGDETYGGGKRRARALRPGPLRGLLLTVSRQMLHARKLSFTHPASREPISITAPLPPDLSELIGKLDGLFAASANP